MTAWRSTRRIPTGAQRRIPDARHHHRPRHLLSDRELLATRAYVAGEWRDADGGATFAVENPARGDRIADVADLSRAEAARAIDAAYDAQKAWARRPAKERAQILRRWFDLMVENADDLATILTAEQGKPRAEARGEILYGAIFIEWFAEEAKRVYGEIVPGHQADKRIHVLRQADGVAAAITPWNFPNAMITRKAGAGACRRLRVRGPPAVAHAALGAGAGRAGRPRRDPRGRALDPAIEVLAPRSAASSARTPRSARSPSPARPKWAASCSPRPPTR